MPLPNTGENMKDFIKRFMGNPEMVEKYPNEEQRYAIAISEWGKSQSQAQNYLTHFSYTNNMSALVETTEMAGRQYHIVPMVMMPIECVMNGKKYTKEATNKNTVFAWNGRPVLAYHPDGPMSANDPEIYAEKQIGVVFNTRIENDLLKADAYIDIEKAKAIPDGQKVLSYLEMNIDMDVSTGMLTTNEFTGGNFNGKEYAITVRSYIPDHLAVLPDQKGASSRQDGAGFVLNKEQNNENNNGEKRMKKELLDQLVTNGIINEDQKSEYEKAPDSVGEKLISMNASLNKKNENSEKKEKSEKEEPVQNSLSLEDQAAINYGKQQMEKDRSEAIATITANSKNFTAEDLGSYPLDILKKMASDYDQNSEKEPENKAIYGISGQVVGESVVANSDKQKSFLSKLNNR